MSRRPKPPKPRNPVARALHEGNNRGWVVPDKTKQRKADRASDKAALKKEIEE